MRRGFTLIELLVVIAIVAVLAVTVILTLNPAELLKQARDSRRISDITTLNRAMGFYLAQGNASVIGSTSTIYVSVPDSSSSCANIGIGTGFTCASTSTFTSIGGTGWIPAAFATSTSQSPFSALPVDPVNATSTGLYYTFRAGDNATWKLSAKFESAKYASTAANDGGTDTGRLERGSNLALVHAAAQAPGTPILWLAADALTGLSNGAQINTWTDSSASANNATGLAGVGTKPMYESVAINGKPAVLFSGGGYFSLPNILNGSTAAEIFYVLRIPVDGQYNGFSTFGSNSQNDHYGYYGAVYDGFGSNNRFGAGDPPSPLDSWHIYNVSANATWTARQNGTSFYTAGNTYSYSTAPLIGRSMPAGVAFNGEIAEVLLYGSVLDTTTRAAVHAYLQAKYGL